MDTLMTERLDTLIFYQIQNHPTNCNFLIASLKNVFHIFTCYTKIIFSFRRMIQLPFFHTFLVVVGGLNVDTVKIEYGLSCR